MRESAVTTYAPRVIRFTSFSNHPIEYYGQIYPTAEHRTLSTVESESPGDSYRYGIVSQYFKH